MIANRKSAQMYNERIGRFVGIAFLCLAVIRPSDLFALQEHARGGWLLGVSLGSGPGKYEDSMADVSSSEPGGLITFRVGRMIQPSLLLEAELTGWAREEEASEAYEEGTLLSNLALAGTFYPLDPLSLLGGVYVRAGIGSGAITNILTSKVNSIALSTTETGLGFLLGAGFELRVTKKFALGVGVSFDKLSIGGEVYESAQFIGYALDFNWYL